MIRARRINKKDCAEVARLHLQYLQTNFSGWAGEKVLSCYYEAIADQQGAIGYVAATSDERPVGYVCGIWDFPLLRRHLIKQKSFRVAFYGLVQLFINPKILVVIKSQLNNRISAPQYNNNGYELRPIVVSREARGTKVATELVRILLLDAKKRGFPQVHLYTEPNNRAARRFYLKVGFIESSLVERPSLPVIRYIIDV